MLLALHNCYHKTLLKATMYRIMPQELEGYEIDEIEAHTTCILDNDTVGCMSSEFVFLKLLCGILNIVRMLRIIRTVKFQ